MRMDENSNPEWKQMLRGTSSGRKALEVIGGLESELERERIRLAACGVVALSNTRESAANSRQMHDDYRSASCDDVANAVDKQMEYRERLAEMTQAVGLLSTLYPEMEIDIENPVDMAQKIVNFVNSKSNG